MGERRWRAPRPVTPWPGFRDADRFAGACAQQARPVVGGAEVTDERFDAAQSRLAQAMTTFWSRFADTGAPGPLTWPPTAPAPYRPLSLAPDAIALRTDFETAHQCAFWATVEPPGSQGPVR